MLRLEGAVGVEVAVGSGIGVHPLLLRMRASLSVLRPSGGSEMRDDFSSTLLHSQKWDGCH